MQKKMFQEKYPIFELKIAKSDCKYDSVAAILDDLQAKIEAHPKACFIARFDHLSHTQSIEGEINPQIKDAQNIIFCFGFQIPGADPVAVRPRAIGVTDLGDTFVVNFMEAPNPVAQETMQTWVKDLVK
ncbi:DUF6858 family protein [Thiomicrorhabdus cannonii]|uniref:DUF6858 family protein n=1 Tax=Thiomicrorhabdus cannonii TaxID=2748011 RepID=UPI0015B7F6FB|nr:hypothetical protein [Thiomicrorhabdus cannonii]